MSSLFGSMSIALQSLLAQQGALGVVANNVANANTPGYTREIPILEETPPTLEGNVLVGTGVTMASVQSVRDNILNLRIQQETSQDSSLTSYVDSMQQVEALFNETSGTGLQSVLSSFFNSFQSLAADPTDSSLREAVITAGQNLASAFNQTSQSLTTIQSGLDQSVVQTVGQINQLSSQIATLNGQIQAVTVAGQDAGTLEDQRDEDLQNLSQLVDTAVVYSDDGTVSVTTSNGVLLVAGNQSQSLTAQLDTTTGMHEVMSQGSDVTSEITGGQLEGLLDARDEGIPSTQSALDNLAASLTSAVNAQQMKGYDLNGVKGQDFFVPFTSSTPGSNAGAAAAMAVAVSDPDLVAASSDGTAGSSGNATALADLQNQAIVSGETPTDYYANLVDQVGSDVSNASSEEEGVSLVLQQLTNQQSSVSGVSLDEEASNLILYQRAYEAAARVMSVVDELTYETVNIGDNTP
jgi:flagellar hook-associated protein 1 FlgK